MTPTAKKKTAAAPKKKTASRQPDKTIGWNMYLTVLGKRLFDGRLNSSRIRAWMAGKYYPEILPKEAGKPRMVRWVPVPTKTENDRSNRNSTPKTSGRTRRSSNR